MDGTKWDATSLQPNTVSIISGIDRYSKAKNQENHLLQYLYLHNYNKVDYLVHFSLFALLHDDCACIGPKIHMACDIQHLKDILAFQRRNTELRVLMVLKHCMSMKCVWQNITLRRLFTCRQQLRITIIVFTNCLFLLDDFLLAQADYICTLLDPACNRQDIRFLPQKPYKDALLKFPTRVSSPEVPEALLVYSKITTTFQWFTPFTARLLENTKAPDVQMSPVVYQFLLRYWSERSLTTQPVLLNPAILKRFVNNWFRFAVRRLYARVLVVGKSATEECGPMFQLQGFFKENPGLLKYVGTKLLLFC